MTSIVRQIFVDGQSARFNTHVIGAFAAGKITGLTYGAGVNSITPPSTFTTALGPIDSLY